MHRRARWFGGLWGVAFVAAAYLQLNDPDPWLWASAYSVAAVLAVGGEPLAWRSWMRIARTVGVAGCGLGAAWCVYGSFKALGASEPLRWNEVFGPGGMMSAGVEEVREALGLVIVGLRLGWLILRKFPAGLPGASREGQRV